MGAPKTQMAPKLSKFVQNLQIRLYNSGNFQVMKLKFDTQVDFLMLFQKMIKSSMLLPWQPYGSIVSFEIIIVFQ